MAGVRLGTRLSAALIALCAAAGACGPPSSGGASRAADPIRTALPAFSPPEAGLEPGRLNAAIDRAADLPQLRTLIVARDGVVAAERVFRGPGLDTPVNIKSAAKSVLSSLVGIAIERGVLDGVEQPIAPVLAGRIPDGADPRLRQVTVGNLLSMQAGLERTSGRNYGAWVTSRDWVRYALSRPFVEEPGGGMLYSTGSTHLLSAILTEESGRSTLALARDWLGEPLGVTIPAWPRDPQGVYFGGNDMLMSPRAMLRFGELYRNGGVRDGRRVVPAEWVRASWTPKVRSPRNGNGYGYGWWLKTVRGHDVAFAWGYGGQMIYVAPDLALTVVMTSDPGARSVDGHLQSLHAIFDELLVPAAELGASPGAPVQTS